MLKLNAKQLRRRKPTSLELKKIKRRPLYIVLDNVLDTYNIGGLFRLADAVGAKKLFLCGQTETPPSSRIHKTAVGLEYWVKWEYFEKTEETVETLAKKGITIIAIEQYAGSIPYSRLTKEIVSGKFGVALIVGHETKGVAKNILKMADLVVDIPMFGVNQSLNVIVAAAIVAYKILEIQQAVRDS